MPLDNLFETGVRREARRLARRSLKWGFIAYLLTAFPAWPIEIMAITAFVLGCLLALRLDRYRELMKPVDNMKAHRLNGQIDDRDIARYTLFGLGIDFREWKLRRIELERRFGNVTSEHLRDLEHELFPKMTPMAIADSSLLQHALVVMPTGGGKTVFYTFLQRQFIARGLGMICVELKGSQEYVDNIVALADECGRLDDVRVIALDKPEFSHSYSPLFSGSTRSLIDQLTKIQNQSSEQFFEDVARYGASAAMLTLKLQSGGRKFRVSDVAALLGDLELLRTYIRKIDPRESNMHSTGRKWLLVYLNFWREDGEWNHKDYKRFQTGMMQSLMNYCHSEYNSIVNVYEPDVHLRDAITEGKIIIMTASTNADEKGVNKMGRMLIADLVKQAGELETEGFKPLFPCPLLIDEYRAMRDARDINMVQLFRSIGVPTILNVQVATMLNDLNDPNFMNNLIGNIDTMIVGRSKDEDTRDLFAKAGSTYLAKTRQESVSRSEASSASSDTTGIVTTNNSGLGHSDGYREAEQFLITAEDLRDLDNGQFIMLTKRGVYRMIGPLVELPAVMDWQTVPLARFRKEYEDSDGIYESYARQIESELM